MTENDEKLPEELAAAQKEALWWKAKALELDRPRFEQENRYYPPGSVVETDNPRGIMFKPEREKCADCVELGKWIEANLMIGRERRDKCADGDHEATGHRSQLELKNLASEQGNDTAIACVCKHCRAVFVPK